MLHIIPDHGSDLLKVHFITAPLNIVNLVEKAFHILLHKVAREFREELPQAFVGHFVFALVE